MHIRIKTISVAFLAALIAAAPAPRTWDFEEAEVGEPAPGVSPEVGRWEVVDDGEGHALAQLAENGDEIFNVALVEGVEARGVDLTVRFRAVTGEYDRGGGLVWRAKDTKNYYIARYNPLEDNFRVYTVVEGVRTRLDSAEIPHTEGWHTLGVRMRGDRIRCFYDGEVELRVRDDTFADAGRIGLWTKADAVTWFDDLTLAEPPAGE